MCRRPDRLQSHGRRRQGTSRPRSPGRVARIQVSDAGAVRTAWQAISPLVDRITDIQSDAEFILLVEKDAAFIRLSEDRFYNTYPCIIITVRAAAALRAHVLTALLTQDAGRGGSRILGQGPAGRGHAHGKARGSPAKERRMRLTGP